MTDNFEFEDIDIMEITDPANPTLVAEVDANDYDVAREGVVSHGNFQGSFLHDMVVKKIGRTWTLLVSYWDGGWVKFNVVNPSSPEYMIDSDYPLPGPRCSRRSSSRRNAPPSRSSRTTGSSGRTRTSRRTGS